MDVYGCNMTTSEEVQGRWGFLYLKSSFLLHFPCFISADGCVCKVPQGKRQHEKQTKAIKNEKDCEKILEDDPLSSLIWSTTLQHSGEMSLTPV